ncbi:MAG: DUF3488 domain-containing transglutaminase family protein [Chromatiales bacterium]|nr:DUF3488 domain-containing transglutaminase family protein [Chromatiales bacterium]
MNRQAEQLPGWAAPVGPLPRRSASLPELGWLLAVVSAACAPHLPHLAGWIILAIAGAMAWRLLAAFYRWPLPGRWPRGLLAIAGLTAVLLSYRSISGIDAGSALMAVMLSLKLLETRQERDRVVVILIAWFLLFTAFLREQSIWSGGYLLLGLVLGTGAMLASTRGSPPLNPLLTVRQGVRLLLPALPLALMLFLLFPRISTPFWGLPTQAGGAMTGLTEEMTPGNISSLALSDAVAFRVRFLGGEAPEPAELYWRGPVFERFDGRSWSPGPARETRAAVANVDGRLVDYEMVIEPHGRQWLLALEAPLEWRGIRARLNGRGELLADVAIDQRLAWRGRARLSGRLQADDTPGPALTALPDGRNPRSLVLARELQAASRDERDYLARVLALFRDEPFYYTLEPQPLGLHPVDDFLFATRSGFCEHYASAFAVLARAAGIPARVVTGYQGGERNPIGEHWVVRQADAHAWTEVLLDGEWQRIDPTAVIPQSRILPDRFGRQPGLAGAGRQGWRGNPALESLLLSWDAASARWDRWVLGFDEDTQLALLDSLGVSTPSTRSLVAAFSAALLAAILGLSLLYGRQLHPRSPDPVQRLWERFCTRLARVTRGRLANEGPAEYAEAVLAERPDLAPEVRAITRLYLALRYEGQFSPAALGRLRRAIAAFHPARPAAR